MRRSRVSVEEFQACAGTMTTAELAAKFGVSEGRIRQLRQLTNTGAPPRTRTKRTSKYSEVVDTPEFQEALGTMSDAELSQRFSVPMHAVQASRRIAGKQSGAAARRSLVIPLLGTVPDAELADRFGYSLSGIVALRRRHNVEGIPHLNSDGTPRRKRRSSAEMEAYRQQRAADRAAGKIFRGRKPRSAVTVTAGKDVDVSRPSGVIGLDAATIARLRGQMPMASDVADNVFAADLVKYLKVRRAEGDSLEALAARLEVPEETVRTLIQG